MNRAARMVGVRYIEKVALTAPWEVLHERDNVQANSALIGAGLGTALGAGMYAKSRPGIRAALSHAGQSTVDYVKNLLQPGRQSIIDAARSSGGMSAEARAQVAEQAKLIAAKIREAGLDPEQARIAVAGLGGSGKGTLAAELARELGIKSVELDDLTKGLRPAANTLEETFGTAQNNLLKPGLIAEQKRVMTELDPDMFDAVIRLDRDPARIREQLISRGRGAWQSDLLDNDKSQKVLNYAFDNIKGDAFDAGDGVALKLRPAEGFGLKEKLHADMASRGIDPGEASQFENIQRVVAPRSPAFKGVAGEANWDELSRLGMSVGGAGVVGGSAGYVAGTHS